MMRSFACLCGIAIGLIPLVSDSALAQKTNVTPDVGIQEHPIQDVWVTNAKVVVEPGRVIEAATIAIVDGKIAQIGTGIVPPVGSRIVDLSGKTIYPGFVDLAVDVEIPAMEAARGTPHWNADIMPDRSVASDAGDAQETLSKLRKAGITAALVSPSDGIIKGTSAVVLTGEDSLAYSIIKPEAALHVRLTVSRGRGRGEYPSSPMGAVALARQTFLDAQWYESAWQAYRANKGLPMPERNSGLEALAAHMASGKFMVFDALNEQYVLRANDFANEFGIRALIRGSGQEYQLLEPIARAGRPLILPLNFPKPPQVNSIESALDTELEELMHWEMAPENPARVAKASIPFTLSTQGLSDPAEFVPQIRKAIERGLDPTTALASITTTPASWMDMSSQLGSLNPGSWANLVVASGDLWDDKTKLEEVWVRGQRPGSAIKNESDVDGLWELQTIAIQSASKPEKTLPKTLELLISGSDKKVSAAFVLAGVAPTAATPEVTTTPEGTTKAEGSDKPERTDKPEATDKSDKSEGDKTQGETAPDEQAKDSTTDATNDSPKSKGSEPKKSDSKVKLTGVQWSDATFSGQFTAKSVAAESSGVAVLSLARLMGTNQDATLIGSIVWPDGTVQSVRGVKKPKSPGEESAKTKDSKSSEKSKKETKVLSSLRYPFASLGRTGLPVQPAAVVVQNTTLWTCGPQGILRDADMLVRNGVIEAIGMDLPVPEGAIVIDGSKFEVSPGLIDCHSHMATDSGVNEATQAVTAEVRIGDFVNAEDVTIYRQLAGGLTSANVLHGSANPIGGQNQVIKLRWGGTYEDLKFSGAPGGIKFALGENVKQSNRNEIGTRYPQSRMGVEQIFRDRFNAAGEYQRAWKSWTQSSKGLPPRRDLELEALAEILRGERWIHCHSYRQDEILGLLRVLDDYHITIGSLQHILEGYKVADAIAKHGGTASSFSDWWAYKLEVYDAIPHNGALMHQQGIVVSFNSDDAELGRHMNHEAAKAVKYGGVDPHEALKFVTLNPAIQLRIDKQVGSLELGKHADFALWNGSPLSPRSRCEQTWIDGRKYFDREMDTEVRQQDGQLHRELVQKVLDSGEAAGDRSPLADDPSRLWPNHDEYCHHHHDDDGGFGGASMEDHDHDN